MIKNYDLLTALVFTAAMARIVFAFVKFKGPKAATWTVVLAAGSVGLQVTAFAVLPLDVMVVGEGHQAAGHLDEGRAAFMEVYWPAFYWSNFGLAFFVLPFAMYYSQSAAFTQAGRARDALTTLAYWTLGPAVLGVAFWLYLLATGRIRWSTTDETVIALANA